MWVAASPGKALFITLLTRFSKHCSNCCYGTITNEFLCYSFFSVLIYGWSIHHKKSYIPATPSIKCWHDYSGNSTTLWRKRIDLKLKVKPHRKILHTFGFFWFFRIIAFNIRVPKLTLRKCIVRILTHKLYSYSFIKIFYGNNTRFIRKILNCFGHSRYSWYPFI